MRKHVDTINLLGTAAPLTVVASGNWTTLEQDISKIMQEGKLSIGYTATGTGVFKIESQISFDNAGWTALAEVATGLEAGTVITTITALLAPYIRFKITETGTAASIIFSRIVLIAL